MSEVIDTIPQSKLRNPLFNAIWSLDSSGNPVGLVGPDGEVLTVVRAETDNLTGGIVFQAGATAIYPGGGARLTPSGDTTGATDATQANAAVTAAIAAGGGNIVFDAGTYYFNAPIVLLSATGVRLIGEGRSATLKLADNQNAAVPGDMKNLIEITSSTKCEVRGLVLDGNYQNQNMANLAMSFGDLAQGGSGNRRDPFTIRYVGAGTACSMTISGNTLTTSVTGGPGGENLSLDLTAVGYDTIAEVVAYIDGLAAYQATIVHNTFGSQKSSRLYARAYADIKTSTTGIDFTNASNAVTHEIYGNNIIIKDSNKCCVANCDLRNSPHMGVLITGNSSYNLVTECTGEYNNWRACEIWPNAGTESTGNLISNNRFSNSYHDSIVSEFPGTYRNTISNNKVLVDDLSFGDATLDGIAIYNSIGNLVIGNNLTGCRIRVFTTSPNYNAIVNNTIDGLNRHASIDYRCHGIWIAEGVGNLVQGNVVNDTFYNAIHISAAASKTLIKNNIITNVSSGGVSPVPIYIDSGSADNVLDDNMLVGNALGLSDSGTRTIHNGVGQNGSNDPASAGNWNGNGVEGVVVQWNNGGGKNRLSQYSGGAWVNYYVEP